MNVCFRVDASRSMGTGHVMRSLALADALRRLEVQSTFICGPQAGEWVARRGYEHIELASDSGTVDSVEAWHSDAAQTQSAIGALRNKPDWLIVDDYSLDARWHRALRAFVDRITAVDDLADRDLDCDVLVDHNHAADHRRKYADCVDRKALILGGPRFALINPRYAEVPRHQWRSEVRSIGIFMGGADTPNLSETALRACRDHANFHGRIEIVSTRLNPHLDRLRAAADADGEVDLSIDQPDLADFFSKHDLQIGVGGGATWERCCLGVPAVTVAYVENQWVALRALADLGILVTAELTADAPAETLGNVVRGLLDDAARRQRLAERSREVVDGLGAMRVAFVLSASTLKVRSAVAEDARIMHSWRDDPRTREVSLTRDSIPWDSHVKWLYAALADQTRTLLVGQIGSTPVGVIRFDRAGEAATEVSLYLDPRLYGLGLGRALLSAGEEYEAARRPGDLRFTATVRETNFASRRLFESAGYVRAGRERWTKSA